MDNEKQIKDLVTRSKNVFLRDAIPELTEKQNYVLEDEFAKTKRNRNLFVWFSLAALVVVFLLATIILTGSIQKSAENVQVEVKDFEDVNLQDVLDRAKRLENSIRDVQLRLVKVKEEKQIALNAINNDNAQRRDIIVNQRISENERKRRLRDLDADTARQIQALDEKYDPSINELEEELAALQAEMEQYDARRLAEARAQQEILNNQKRLFDMEMERTVSQYEERLRQMQESYETELAKATENQANLVRTIEARVAAEKADLVLLYNPNITEQPVADILSLPVSKERLGDFQLAQPDQMVFDEKILTEAQYTAISTYVDHLRTILAEFEKIPYENSIPPALKQIETAALEILGSYEALISSAQTAVSGKIAEMQRMNRSVKSLRAEIDQYRYALDSLVRQNRENGYIIDPRNTADIGYFLHDLHLVNDGDFGIVFRQDNEYIGKVGFKKEGDRLRAFLAELNSQSNPMQPFDKILLEVNQETAQ